MAKTISERYSHTARVHDARVERAKNAREKGHEQALWDMDVRILKAKRKYAFNCEKINARYAKREANAYARALQSIARIEGDELLAMQLSIAFA